MLSTILTELMTAARQEQLGIYLEVQNPSQMIMRLQGIKRDRQMNDLMICSTPIDNVIFIVKKSVELDI